MRGSWRWLGIGLATALVTIGVAAQTGTPGHPLPRVARSHVRAVARLPAVSPSAAPNNPAGAVSGSEPPRPPVVAAAWENIGGASAGAVAATFWGTSHV